MTTDPPSSGAESSSIPEASEPLAELGRLSKRLTTTTTPPIEPILNVLAERYASAEMKAIWSAERKIVLERELWLVVLRAQREAGVDIPDGAIEAYEAEVHNVNLASIAERERVTRHDVKARIEEFCALAGYEHIHRGMTSRDLTENVEQAQLRESLQLVRDRLAAVLARVARLANHYADTPMVGRTHNVPAQVTTLGKRWATIGEEVLSAHRRLTAFLGNYQLRGLKGPVGTQQDMLEQLHPLEAVEHVEQRLVEHLGFEAAMNSVGQVYPRSLDAEAVSALVGVVAPLSNMATAIRLMAGHDLVTEGFSPGQVGSSAMPHKMNTRSSERINGLMTVLRGYLTMAAGLAGDQWNEGDVSCSVVRRVVLPDACFATDGAIETALNVLDEFGAYEEAIDAELQRYLPFLLSTQMLALALEAGCGREEAHAIIGEHLTDAARRMREEGTDIAVKQVLSQIAADTRLGIDATKLNELTANPHALVGRADLQVGRFEVSARLFGSVSDKADYTPAPIL